MATLPIDIVLVNLPYFRDDGGDELSLIKITFSSITVILLVVQYYWTNDAL